MNGRRFAQVDVFSARPGRGNPVAVVLDGDDLDDESMTTFARWTNLSETTFVVSPTDPGADYRVRIFTPYEELPFAGHPTLGTCHAWLEAGGVPADPERIVQECGVGLVTLRRVDGRLAFEAPPLLRSGPVGADLARRMLAVLGLRPDQVSAMAWIDNGPGWMGVLVDDPATVAALEPDPGDEPDLDIGVAARTHDPGGPALVVRAFMRTAGGPLEEDPVTGSLQASLAQWLLAEGAVVAPYVASQGEALAREGRVHVSLAAGASGDEAVWVAGDTHTLVHGHVELGG